MASGNSAILLSDIRFRVRPNASHHEPNLREEERLRERTRIARELHDTLLQGLFSASLQLHVAAKHLAADSLARPFLDRALILLEKGMDEGRAAIQRLRSAGPTATSLEQALSDFGNELTSGDRKRLRILITGRPRALHSHVEQQLHLVAQEALRNALRHSQSPLVEVELEYLPKKLRIVVRDNGCGVNPQVLSSKASCYGLLGMRERAQSIGAHIRIWSKPGLGTEVEVTVGLPKPTSEPLPNANA